MIMKKNMGRMGGRGMLISQTLFGDYIEMNTCIDIRISSLYIYNLPRVSMEAERCEPGVDFLRVG